MRQDIDWNNIREVQQEIHAWANRTFPKRTDYGAFTKLVMEEIPELIQHKKEKGVKDIGPELADTFILLMDLAMMWGVDIPSALANKMEVNDRRMWNFDPVAGVYQHVAIKHPPVEQKE